MTLMRRPTNSNADEWQLYLQDGLQGQPDTACAFLSVQIVEAIEEHQRALASEVYRLAENTAMRFSDLASEDTPSGHFYRGSIHEAKNIARAINAIMPLSRFPLSLSAEVKGLREALEWQPIETAPQGEDVLIAVFREDFEDPIIQNSILIDGEDKGLYWSDWHGMPKPTHWMRYPALSPIPTHADEQARATRSAPSSTLSKDTTK